MSNLEVILWGLADLNEEDLLKAKKEIERILNEAHDR
tara:strand:- start:316 stop:426 length:111 start_codon:yes stop_codon:yes gene_type:complete